ncbi:MAG: hypothetical protein R2752_16820 [Vicinamibacterales bacterium]
MKLSRALVVLALVAAVRLAAGSLPDAAATHVRAMDETAQTPAAGRMSAPPASSSLGATWQDHAQAPPTTFAASAWTLDGLHAFLAGVPVTVPVAPAFAPRAHAPDAASPGLPHGPPHLRHDSLRI